MSTSITFFSLASSATYLHPLSYHTILHASGPSNWATDSAFICPILFLRPLILICGSSFRSFIFLLISQSAKLITHSTSLRLLGGLTVRPLNVAGRKPMRWLRAQKKWAQVHDVTHLMTILGIIIGEKLPEWVLVLRYCFFVMKSKILCSWNVCAEVWRSYWRSCGVCQRVYWIRCGFTTCVNQGLDCPLPSLGKRSKEAKSVQEGKLR
jgi:hypothetical protein